jgi:small subunit ribosomal protein S16
MAVIIRLRRDGAKNSPYYRIVVADKHSPRDGKFLELIGTYDPKKKGDNSTIKLERAAHWMKLGALPSDTVKSILKKAKAKSAKAEKEAAAEKEKEEATASVTA